MNQDPSGEDLLGAMIGGAIGGALISAASYMVNCGLTGNNISVVGMANAIVTGAVGGAIGGAIGMISLVSTTATMLAKGAASIGLGIAMGVKAGFEHEGAVGEQVMIGISTGAVTALGTFAGAQFATNDLPFVASAFANYCTTVSVGAPAEVVSVAIQTAITSNRPKPHQSQSWQSYMRKKSEQIIEAGLLL